MKARLVARRDVLRIVDLLRADGREVLAPFRGRGRDTFFDTVTDENRDRIELHLPNPYYPPKRYVLPPIERLLRVQKQNGGYAIEPTVEAPRRAIFGLRSCDVAGIHHLDRFYLGRDFVDPYYAQRRRNLFLVNFVCTDPERDIGEECFCVCADTGPAARGHFDLQLMDLGDEFMAVAGTPAGEALFADPIFRRGTPAHVARRRAILEDVRRRFKTTTSWFAAAIRLISQGGVPEKTWEQIGNRCLECGGCTYVCPACTCFTVSDRPVGPDAIERVRLWDSCALGGFTRMAGGHNPRRAVHDRRNRRFFRKLAHYFIQRELAMACVGCGRCAAVCHGDIGMPTVVEMIRRAPKETAPA
ncbi:MAG TPA: 4Fe-4S dicluster domain-containing protein [Opitutaceae bacterium]|nr:4Fe-4S dicluster domain-containing protein [Opitutaceae bacterium]